MTTMIFSYLSILAAAGSALAVTPQGFSPGVQAPLFVLYSDSVAALNGATMSKMTTSKEPFVGTEQKLTGKSYAIMMVDMDIPTSQPPKTRSLLHWMQTDLVPVDKPVTVNTTVGTTTVYPVSNLKRVVAAAPYIGPDPPARVPLNHRYTQVLVDTSNVGQEQMRILSKAATKREDFNVAEVLSAANIPTDKIVAGNFFQVRWLACMIQTRNRVPMTQIRKQARLLTLLMVHRLRTQDQHRRATTLAPRSRRQDRVRPRHRHQMEPGLCHSPRHNLSLSQCPSPPPRRPCLA
ncbi:hypothetical protein MCOR25_002414 [Pyricularia grisea]|nr:hypothetical protein MCOR25_002414 [Pyricularia grisea]